jgi:hypothetical protein
MILMPDNGDAARWFMIRYYEAIAGQGVLRLDQVSTGPFFAGHDIDTGLTYGTSPPNYNNLTAAVRDSDNKVFVGCVEDHPNSSGDIRCYRIDSQFVSVQRTSVGVAGLEATAPNFFIDNNQGHLYACWLEGIDFENLVRVFVKRSLNDGQTWETMHELGATLYNEGGTAELLTTGMPMSLRNEDEGYFIISWYNADLNEFQINAVNREHLGRFMTRAATDGGVDQTTVACATGLALVDDENTIFTPNTPSTMGDRGRKAYDILVPLAYTSISGLVVGDRIIGPQSGATGLIVAINTTTKQLTLAETQPGPGPNGTPFLSHEVVTDVATGAKTATVAQTTAAVSGPFIGPQQ